MDGGSDGKKLDKLNFRLAVIALILSTLFSAFGVYAGWQAQNSASKANEIAARALEDTDKNDARTASGSIAFSVTQRAQGQMMFTSTIVNSSTRSLTDVWVEGFARGTGQRERLFLDALTPCTSESLPGNFVPEKAHFFDGVTHWVVDPLVGTGEDVNWNSPDVRLHRKFYTGSVIEGNKCPS